MQWPLRFESPVFHGNHPVRAKNGRKSRQSPTSRRGIAYESNQDAQAIADLDQAIKIDQNNADAFRMRAEIYRYEGATAKRWLTSIKRS